MRALHSQERFSRPLTRYALSQTPIAFCDISQCNAPCSVGKGFAQSASQADARGDSLEALLAANLRNYFHCWRGASGARYLCSIYPIDEDAAVVAIRGAVILGVDRCEAPEALRVFCVFASKEFDLPKARAFRLAARARGGCEWHVRFNADARTGFDLAHAFSLSADEE
jgi:hypothetical protein